MLEANRRLIAFLGRLGEQLHDDARDLSRNALNPLARWHWLSCNMAMDPLHRLGCSKRQRASEHLVERDAERVKVAARID